MNEINKNTGIEKINVFHFNSNESSLREDDVIIESALEISIESGKRYSRKREQFAITMRTPGNDKNLISGFLFNEGIIKSNSDIIEFIINSVDENKICVSLNENIDFDPEKLNRHLYISSSCGICGKKSFEKIIKPLDKDHVQGELVKISNKTVLQLNTDLKSKQELFNKTGGNHAAALFNLKGELAELAEDVGRHNALDKLIGTALLKKMIPLKNHVILLSGRISYELVQKAAMADCRIIAAIGAPSSAAIEMANNNNITLIGFLKQHSFNVYTHPEKINYEN